MGLPTKYEIQSRNKRKKVETSSSIKKKRSRKNYDERIIDDFDDNKVVDGVEVFSEFWKTYMEKKRIEKFYWGVYYIECRKFYSYPLSITMMIRWRLRWRQ